MSEKISLPTRLWEQAKWKTQLFAQPATDDKPVKTSMRMLASDIFHIDIRIPGVSDVYPSCEDNAQYESNGTSSFPDEADQPPHSADSTNNLWNSNLWVGAGIVASAGLLSAAAYYFGLTVKDDKAPLPLQQPEPVMIHPTQDYAPLINVKPAP